MNRLKRKAPKNTEQFTVRNIPAHVAKALRGVAARSRKSLNRSLVEALTRQAGLNDSDERVFHDLDCLAGKWEEDAEFDMAMVVQDQVDESVWK